ncbi:hypothetical protein NA8A_22381 [Nitratireductor indicus C115]|uniref:Uncharacterized protein n=1 Tax=Nitratireductor indicus C115 TaxID=1231190 RepID=K2MY71_9HYPH|nr:hypothetical protein [Nitratireductor indicus]EKF40163.1 hypothetical protein NA8A_22381 [Nitratireductor indicus C115]SFQ80246.1 hypothetical protein SAMN05216176_11791 [Nitratireductor indicus]
MTGIDHAHTEAVQEAARWLAMLPDHEKPHPVVPALRARFGLSPKEACEAITQACLIRGRAL